MCPRSSHGPPTFATHQISRKPKRQLVPASAWFALIPPEMPPLTLHAAVSLAIGYDLHKIRSSRYLSSTLLGLREGTELYTHPAHDSTDEGERINGFWTSYWMSRVWAVVVGVPSPIFDVDGATQIDTPWPLDMEVYERVSFPTTGSWFIS